MERLVPEGLRGDGGRDQEEGEEGDDGATHG